MYTYTCTHTCLCTLSNTHKHKPLFPVLAQMVSAVVVLVAAVVEVAGFGDAVVVDEAVAVVAKKIYMKPIDCSKTEQQS